ncbi:Uncharacterised protein [Escherichia coli]|uniref:Uncharacterized protein n=1 Tax=Escherichia coli TaxID=562 RepID=A0A377CED0_ECOLX|nr:Uncharacterised protein [Escherichia coli]
MTWQNVPYAFEKNYWRVDLGNRKITANWKSVLPFLLKHSLLLLQALLPQGITGWVALQGNQRKFCLSHITGSLEY